MNVSFILTFASLTWLVCSLNLAIAGGTRPAAATPQSETQEAQKQAEQFKQLVQKLHKEEKTDDYLPIPKSDRPRKASRIISRNGVHSIQVNVDANGMNIDGDAANEPSIAIDPTNPCRMVIGWRQFDNIASNFRQAGRAYSLDGGLNWCNSGPFQPGRFRSDPVLSVNSAGDFFYYSLQGGQGSPPWACDTFISGDGINWSTAHPAWGGDKAWMTVDRSRSIGNGHVYMAWRADLTSAPGDFTRSVDGGRTYPHISSLPQPVIAGTMDVDHRGDLYICGFCSSAGVCVFKSTNAKDQNQTPTFIRTPIAEVGGAIQGVESSSPNPGGLLGQLDIATDHSWGPHRGNVYLLASVKPEGDDPLDTMFARSCDGGLTWSQPVRINDDPPKEGSFQWFGTMSVAPNGRIDVIWNDTRNCTHPPFSSEMYYAHSHDAGVNWSLPIPVTPSWNPMIGHPNQSKIGDYYDMISDNWGCSVAYAATFNGEQDVFYMRIPHPLW